MADIHVVMSDLHDYVTWAGIKSYGTGVPLTEPKLF